MFFPQTVHCWGPRFGKGLVLERGISLVSERGFLVLGSWFLVILGSCFFGGLVVFGGSWFLVFCGSCFLVLGDSWFLVSGGSWFLVFFWFLVPSNVYLRIFWFAFTIQAILVSKVLYTPAFLFQSYLATKSLIFALLARM